MSDEVRAAYDQVAVSYAALLEDELAGSTWDRAVLDAFVELVGDGPVADLGCGPGRITGYLADKGLDMQGVDLSPGMVEEARRRHPTIGFQVGSLVDLPLPDGGLAGALAWYSLIHTPPELLPVVAAELKRVLRPGAPLLLAFQSGGQEHQPRTVENAYGHENSFPAWRLSPGLLTALLEQSGFTREAILEREPVSYEKTPQVYALYRA